MEKKYREEEVRYENKSAGITLAGTLTIPNVPKKHPAVILIAGYGAHDRNLTFMEKQPFRVIADYLTQKGIAVLRFDKRGVGQSTGDYTTYATSTTQDFASDVQAGIAYLKTRSDIDIHHMGLVGLSEGGLIATMIASVSKDLAFIILMAPALYPHSDDLVEMTELQLKADGASKEFIARDAIMRKQLFAIIKNEPDMHNAYKKLRKLVADYLAHQSEAQRNEAEKLPWAFTASNAEDMIEIFNSSWYRFFLSYNPIATLKKIKNSVLAVAGDHDWVAYPGKTFPILDNALKEAGNTDYSLIEFPGLNHVFQESKTGAFMEYGTSEEPISPQVLKVMADWILARIKK